ncbi:S49 family peptidase [Candidatus Woesearchaeota archaeon]|nr:S49 family peptidase [Candidatus Woesearchaeota archaeon]
MNTVMINRGSTLKLAREEIAQAKIYTGAEALRNGLIDQIGSETDALDRAALLAGVFNYKVQQYGLTPGNVFVIRLSSNETATNTVPLNYFLYVSE